MIADKRREPHVNGELLVNLDESARCLESFLPLVTSTPSQKAVKAESLLRMAAALNALLPDERTALELRYFHDWKLIDIARHMDRPTTKAVSGLMARGLEKLRDALLDNE
jgi:RNA polymerase sigma factor (sigma-70 family)